MASPMVKICGLRSSEHALVAAAAGADLLSFNFIEGVRRQLQPAEGRSILSGYRAAHGPGGPRAVGLFLNQPASFVNEVSASAGLDLAQLCGNESPEYAALIEIPTLKQVRVREGATPSQLRQVVEEELRHHEMIVLDRYDPATPGGAGIAFDWRAAEGVADMPNVLLAGGLTPENVRTAIASLHAWGVDVSSGVETGGVKDSEKIRAFIEAAHTPDRTIG